MAAAAESRCTRCSSDSSNGDRGAWTHPLPYAPSWALCRQPCDATLCASGAACTSAARPLPYVPLPPPDARVGMLPPASSLPGSEGKPRAACILALRVERGVHLRVLTVSRKRDAADWGLPGGKVDATDASVAAAAARELEEETGYLLGEAHALLPILTADGDTGEDVITSCTCTTFLLLGPPLDEAIPSTLSHRAAATSAAVAAGGGGGDETGVVAWRSVHDALGGGSFARYNARLVPLVASIVVQTPPLRAHHRDRAVTAAT